MKRTITLIGASLIALCAHSQSITLTNTGYTHLIGEDTTKGIDTASVSVSSFATAHTAYTWDLTNVPYTAGSTLFTQYSPASAFGTANYGMGVTTNFSALTYSDTAQYNVTSTGVARIGHAMPRQATSLMLITGGTNDSLVFPAQNIVYAGGTYNIIQFPATYNSTWSSAYVSNTAFNLTVALASLNNTPGFRRSYVTVNDTVVGYGNMKVNNYFGNASGLNPVLQVRETFSTRDSFFIAGVPAQGALLASFGLQQGMVSTDYRVFFYRQGETWPLTAVFYTDASRTKSKNANMYVHTQRLNTASAVPGLFSDKDVVVYPNPVVNNLLNVKLPAGNAVWNYELTAVNGQKVGSAQLTPVSGNATISVPASLQSGTYFLRLQSNGGAVVMQKVTIN